MQLENDQTGIIGELTITRIKNGVREVVGKYRNKVVSSSGYGRNIIVRQLANDTTYGLYVNSASAGTGTNAPADGDTDLQTPTVTDIPITNASVSNNILTIDVFVADANLANGTYSEFGLFVGSGDRLFSRVLISPSYTKATGEDTLFSYTLTFTG